MKITSLKPLIISNNAKELIETYNALGFVEIHYKDDIEDVDVDCTILTNENNDRIYISQLDDVPREMTVVHINVDNFDEAYELLKSKGYSDARPEITKTSSTITQMMVSKAGTPLVICQHIK